MGRPQTLGDAPDQKMTCKDVCLSIISHIVIALCVIASI